MNINYKRLNSFMVGGSFQNEFLENLQNHINELIKYDEKKELENFELIEYIYNYVCHKVIYKNDYYEVLEWLDWSDVFDKIKNNDDCNDLYSAISHTLIEVLEYDFSALLSDYDDDEAFKDWK